MELNETPEIGRRYRITYEGTVTGLRWPEPGDIEIRCPAGNYHYHKPAEILAIEPAEEYEPGEPYVDDQGTVVVFTGDCWAKRGWRVPGMTAIQSWEWPVRPLRHLVPDAG